ncbi:phosphatidate cytidylyltransferase [Gilliamella sp. B2889]|uniref:phosphatidate cytidylyltransferase n=1 Tax=unclassified Gilliamella TaxID=2685620 RepID=UPI00226A7ADA|nr:MULTISPECIES: phosphatidate cytidylyltransferase [unclassified Gilliamella]MCX8660270.1 phosphatidate cytidylyltransferase [Gilliamella sp. B2772]MCX8683178.1 phosphatidate cytidylyltransferase [Gilliamella sp. B2889]
MLIQRILTAIVLIPLVIIALFFAPLSIFSYLIIAVCALAAWEWRNFLAERTEKTVLLFLIVFSIVLLYFIPIESTLKSKLFALIICLSVIWWLTALLLVVGYPNSAKYWSKSPLIKLLFAFFTLVPFFIGMLELRTINYGVNSYTGAIWLLYVFVLVWATDTGAYFAGRAIGKRKLAVKVSPGKTVEGFIGGVSLAILVCVIAYLTGYFNINFTQFLFSSLLAVLASVLGDLTESMFKREAGIKDSGNLIPGHGGILDRIDSLTAAVPVFTILSLHLF